VATTTVVCVSRTIGALGEEVGRLVAERLGFRYIDSEIVANAAAREKIDPALVADAEGRRSLVQRVVGALAAAGSTAVVAPELVADSTGQSDHYRALIREAIAESAARGRAVIVAHAASHSLAGQDKLLRVLITASSEVRLRRVAQAQALHESKAAREVKRSDAARAAYLEQFYEVERELPTHYDIVINTDTLTALQAAAIVVQAATI
jgi:hypothetical protein